MSEKTKSGPATESKPPACSVQLRQETDCEDLTIPVSFPTVTKQIPSGSIHEHGEVQVPRLKEPVQLHRKIRGPSHVR